MENNFKSVESAAISTITKIEGELDKLDKKLLQINSSLSNMAKMGGASSPNDLTSTIKKYDDQFKQFTDTIQKQDEQIKKLKDTKLKLNSLSSQEVINQRALRKASDLEATSKSKLVGAYARLNAERLKARNNLRNLIASEKSSNNEIKKAQKEYDKLTNKINKANKATSNFSKTGLGNTIKGFRNLIGAFGFIGGVTAFAEFSKSAFELIKTFQSLEFALEKIVSSEEELIVVKTFLTDITERYGLELVSTTERFTKFLAAAKQSNVSMKDTKQIFDSVSKASSVLGLKTHELEGVYLALEQMLSKGKVTTEELRRQLGERLPGAFGIMADAIGVSVSKLDQMLKKGEVLSSEALPKFAKALEKAYNIENIDSVNTLAASQNRLTAAWESFVFSVESSSGFITKFFSATFNLLASVLKEARMEMEGFAGVMQNEFVKGVDDMNDVLDEYNKKNDLSIKKLEKYLEINEKKVSSVNKEIASIKTQIKFSKEDTNELEKKLDLKVLEIQYLRGYVKSIKDRIDLTQKSIDQQEEENSANNESLKIIKEKRKYQEGSLDDMRNQIAELERLTDATEYGSMQWKIYNGILEALKLKFDALLNGTEDVVERFEDINASLFGNNGDFSENDYNKVRQALRDLKEGGEDAAETLDDIFRPFKEKVFQNAGFDFLGGILTDLDAFKESIENLDSDDKWKGYFVSIAEVAQETFNFLNSQQDYYFERQYERLEQQKNIAIEFAGDSATAKEEIERQYDARRKQIEQQQAKAKKKQAVFNILVDTAQAVVGFLANPGGTQGVGLSIAAGVIGGAQAALVASTDVPQFFRGTMNAPEGWAMVDEKQPEIHTDRLGNIKSTGEKGANLRYLSAGDKIYKSHEEWLKTEYKDVLNQNGMLEYNGMMEMIMPSISIEQGLKKEDFVREIRSMKDAIMSKETSVTNINKNGIETYFKKQGVRRNRLNNILRIKGGIV